MAYSEDAYLVKKSKHIMALPWFTI